MRRTLVALTVFIVLCATFPPADGFCQESESGFPPFLPVTGQPKRHIVKAGEDLYSIGLLYHLSIDHFMMANGISTVQVKEGTSLLVPSLRIAPAYLDNGLVLNLPERMLYLFENKRLVAYYPVAIGATGKWMTPVGDTKIANKAKNPTWLPPEWAGVEKPVPPGAENPLGDRWIGLALPGYGIHATNSPLSIGMAASHGCIRMIPRDAQALYDQVSVGMTVKIVYEPIVIGQAADTGMLYMTVYPDVYGKVPSMKALLDTKLEKYQLARLIDLSQAEQAIKAKKGVCEAILGSDMVLRINEKIPVKLSLPLLKRDQKILAISEFLEPIGAAMQWDESTKTITITREDKTVTLSAADDPSGSGVMIWRGRTIVPLREVAEGLGLSLAWNAKERVISINGVAHMQSPNAGTAENEEKKYDERVRKVEVKF